MVRAGRARHTPRSKATLRRRGRFLPGAVQGTGPAPRLIFDIGANSGEKTEVYLALGARVVAVEPTPELAAYLRQRYGSNPNVSVVPCAASDTAGTTTLWVVANSPAMNTISSKNADILASGVNPRTPDGSPPEMGQKVIVETKTLDGLIAEYGTPDYIKIDVEGHEREVIRGLSKNVPLISFEANLPEFSIETHEIVDRLAAASSGARFQAREHAEFILPAWSSPQQIKAAVASGRPYLEVFVLNPTS